MRIPLHASVVAALILSGCSRRHDNRPQIGVALATDTGAFAEGLRRGMMPAADSLHLTIRLATAGGDPARQSAQVDSFVHDGVAAILIDPVDATGITAAIERANHARVPVLTVVTAASGGAVLSHVGSDDRMGGELAGWYVAQRLRGGGSIAILDQPGVPSVRDRDAGLRLALTRVPNIRIVASPAVEPASREAARRKTAILLSADQQVDALVGTSDDLALGALEAVQAAGRKDVIVVGFGATPEARAAIMQGTALVADVAPDPVTIGRYALLVAASHLRGNRVMALVPVRVRLIDRDSL
jgi:ribose transport system substrate-binding protein